MSEIATTDVATTPEDVARQAQVVIREESREADSTSEVKVHEDHTREMRTPGFSRMRTEWGGAEGAHVAALRAIVDGQMLRLFSDAYVIMNDLWDIVRQPCHTAEGEVITDAHGFPIWARTESGAFIEDYSNLGIRQREDFLFRITTSIFEWKQTAADLWGDAMFAKAIWEENFAHGFVDPVGRLTVEDRTQRARVAATQDRYFAIFQSLMSRKADAIVSSMELIGQRLKDVIA